MDTTAALGTTVKGIEVANLTSGVSVTTNTTTWTDLATLNISSVGASHVTAAATTNVNELTSIANSVINGGKNVTIAHTTAGTVTATATAGALDITSSLGNVIVGGGFAATNALGTVAVKMSATATANAGTIEMDGGTTIAVTATGAISLANRTAHTAAATASEAAKVAAAATDTTAGTLITNLGLFAAKYTAANVLSDTIAESNALTLTELNAGRITAANKVAIDAAYSAAFTAVGGTPTLAQAAALVVFTPIQTAATAAKVVTAAALVTATATDTAADAVVTADVAVADAVDNMVVTATQNTALTAATITGNYGAANSAITDASATNNTLTTVTLNNAGIATVTGLAVATVSMTDQLSNVTVVNATAANTLNLAMNNVTNTTDVSTGVSTSTTVNLAATGTNTVTLTAAETTKLNISGAGSLTLALTADAAAVIDASASSGAQSIGLALGQKYVGGSGVDTVTATTTGTVQAVTVDGGAGTADTVILGHATNYGTTGAAKYLNFEAIKAAGLTVDLSKFTGSTITKESISAVTTLSGMNAAQALGVTISASATPTFTLTGATTPGQLDVLTTDINDGAAAVGAIVLTTPSLLGVETWNIKATDGFTTASLVNASALTNLNVTGAGAVSITTDALAINTNTVFDASASTGAVTFDAALSITNGLKIVGSATAINTITASTTATNATLITGGSAADVLTGGVNSADTISGADGNNVIDGKGGADTITVGNGNNTINAGGIAYVGILTVTAGNGYNTIVGGASADVITVGTGGNTITGGASADVITFGSHAAGVIDGLVYTVAAQTFATTVVSGTTVLTGADIITGLKAGDTVGLFGTLTGGDTLIGTSLLSTAVGTAGDISVVRGNYNAATAIFTSSATGADSIVQWDSNGTTAFGNVETIVLVGFAGVASDSVGSLITLA